MDLSNLSELGASLGLVGISALVFGAVVLVTLAVPALVKGVTGDRFRANRADTERALQDLFVSSLSARDVGFASLGAATVVGGIVYYISGTWFLALAVGAGSLLLRKPILAYLRMVRIAKLEEQLPGALDLLTSYTRAGLSLSQALEELAANTEAPLSQELSLIVQDLKVGADVSQAIDSARVRLGSRTFGLVATALQVSREKGGNLTEALERMSIALKEIWRLEQKLITASTEARKATWIISGAPIGIGIMVLTFQPDMAYALVETLWGLVFLTLSCVIYGLGLWWLLRNLKVVV